MDIVALEIAESVVEGENANVAAVVDMIAAHHRISVILNPDAGQGIPADFIVFVKTLRVIRYVQANVLTIGYVTSTDYWFGTRSANTHGSSDCKYQVSKSVESNILFRLNVGYGSLLLH